MIDVCYPSGSDKEVSAWIKCLNEMPEESNKAAEEFQRQLCLIEVSSGAAGPRSSHVTSALKVCPVRHPDLERYCARIRR